MKKVVFEDKVNSHRRIVSKKSLKDDVNYHVGKYARATRIAEKMHKRAFVEKRHYDKLRFTARFSAVIKNGKLNIRWAVRVVIVSIIILFIMK